MRSIVRRLFAWHRQQLAARPRIACQYPGCGEPAVRQLVDGRWFCEQCAGRVISRLTTRLGD